MENFTLLQNAHPFTRPTRIANTVAELDAGMKLLGYEPIELEFETDRRHERITHYQKSSIIITFYISIEDTVGMKLLNLTNGAERTTSVLHNIAIRDIAAILKVLS